ncbi:TRAP transporter substrate-binding protein [Microvirga yunnanensis]|uniref:TRAP transporter substrate-binding protein n=1 Tax=Microvirga yunnanensis TaxID=2953740 RepID=UPI0021C9E78D|nr:TRAP transporter substrate-binding protein [Microvirga sp. HBU65207]
MTPTTDRRRSSLIAKAAHCAASLSALALAGVWLAGAAAQAQDKPVDLKISLWVPPAHPLVAATKEWAASMEKASGGTIKTTIFPAEQLGKAFDHYDMARDGIADITYVSPGYQPGRFPIINAAQLPFMIANGREGSAAVDEWYRKYAAREMKDVKVCLAFVHDPGSLHSRKKVVAPEDVKGLKVRPAQGTVGEMVTLLGGANVQASAPESREILERGVADAITFPWNSIFLFGIDKVVQYHIDAPLYTTAYVWAMNKDKYEDMSTAQKKVIDDHCTTDWAVKLAGPWADYEAAGRDKMRSASGHEVYPLTPDQLAQWKKAVEPMTKSWAESVRKAGANPDEAMSGLKASLEKHKAGL